MRLVGVALVEVVAGIIICPENAGITSGGARQRTRGHATLKTPVDPGTTPRPVQFGTSPPTPPIYSSLGQTNNNKKKCPVKVQNGRKTATAVATDIDYSS